MYRAMRMYVCCTRSVHWSFAFQIEFKLDRQWRHIETVLISGNNIVRTTRGTRPRLIVTSFLLYINMFKNINKYSAVTITKKWRAIRTKIFLLGMGLWTNKQLRLQVNIHRLNPSPSIKNEFLLHYIVNYRSDRAFIEAVTCRGKNNADRD